MPWLSRVNFIASDTLSFTDINNLGNDIRAWGDNVNGGGYTLSNVVLSASAGTMATVIGGTGTTSTLTLRSTSGVGTTGADIIFQTGNNGATEVMRLQNGGNLGIGEPSPLYKLQLKGAGQTTGNLTDAGNKGASFLIGDNGAAPNNGGALLFAAQVTNGQMPGCAIKTLLQDGTANGKSDLAFSFRAATGDTFLTERVRIKASGDFGIRTSTPASTLDIVGSNATSQQFSYRCSDLTWLGRIGQIVNGNTIGSIMSSGGSWSVSGATFSATKDFNGSFPTAALFIGNQYNSNYETSFRFLRKAGGSTTTDGIVSELMTLDDSGNLKLGGTADRATTAGTNQVVIFNGTAPVGTLANGCSFYSTAGEMRVMDAAGNATLLSPHDSQTNEWIYDSSHTPTGKRLKIDVERLLRFLNDHFGLDCVHDFIQEN